MRAPLLVGFGILSSSCAPDLFLSPAIAPETETVLLVVETDQVALFASDPEERLPYSFPQEEEARITVLQYQKALAELGLEVGEVQLSDVSPHRSLPPFDSGQSTQFDPFDDTVSWTTIETLTSRQAALRLAVPTARDCLDAGGCQLPPHDNISSPACAQPCQPTEPDLPSRPERPQFLPCPTGWRQVPTDDGDHAVPVCEPWPLSGRASCAIDQAHFPGEADCSRIGSPCPSGLFPEGLPQDQQVLHVDPNASPNGDGSAQAPFATITEAVQAAPDNTIIALSKGSHVELPTLSKPITLWGACVAETDLAVGSVWIEREATIKNLRLVGTRIILNASAELQGVLFDSPTRTPMHVRHGQLDASDVVVKNLAPSGTLEEGLLVLLDASATLDRVLFQESRAQMIVQNAGTVTLRDLAILSCRADRAISTTSGTVTIERGVIEDLVGDGIYGENEDTTVHLSDLLLRDVEGEGINVLDQASIVGERIRITRSESAALQAVDARFDLQDLVVRETVDLDDNEITSGNALTVVGPTAQVTVTRALFSQNGGTNIETYSTGSSTQLTDLVLIDASDNPRPGPYGTGILAEGGSQVEVRRALLMRARTIAIALEDRDTLLAGSDLTISLTQPREIDGGYGRAISAMHDASIDLARVLLERNRNIGILAENGASIQLSDARIETTTEPDACVEYACSTGLADGVVSTAYGSVAIDRFAIVNNAAYGVRVAQSNLSLTNGVISGNEIGALIAIEAFDFEQIAQGVVISDNGTDLVVPE